MAGLRVMVSQVSESRPGAPRVVVDEKWLVGFLLADDFYEDAFGKGAFDDVDHAVPYEALEDLALGLGGAGGGALAHSFVHSFVGEAVGLFVSAAKGVYDLELF